jgi:hypothetical protein
MSIERWTGGRSSVQRRCRRAQTAKCFSRFCNKGRVTVEAVAVFQTGLIGQLCEVDASKPPMTVRR